MKKRKHSHHDNSQNKNTTTLLYIIAGILLAWGINQGLGLALATPMPIVAVESNSMVPTFYKGDLLILQGVPGEGIQIEDVIVYAVEGTSQPIVHRVIEINSDGTFQTRGDANPGQLSFEKSVHRNQIIGRVVFIVPLLGWVKIGALEFVLPNIVWIGGAAILIVATLYIMRIQSKKTRGN